MGGKGYEGEGGVGGGDDVGAEEGAQVQEQVHSFARVLPLIVTVVRVLGSLRETTSARYGFW